MEADQPLRILFVEDVPADAELAQRALRTEGLAFTSRCVETKDAFLAALAEFQPDLIISDYAMPDFDGRQALQLSLAHDAMRPFIILTSRDEETAVACMKAGATDYVIKQRMTRLPFAVREALEQKKARLATADAEAAERDQRELADTLREVAALLTGTLDLTAVLDQMLTHIGRVVPHTAANIMLIDAAAGVARVAQSRGYDAIAPGLTEQVRQFRLPLSLTSLRRLIETRQPIIIADTHAYPDWLVTPETAWARSYLGAPIGVRNQLIGFFNLDSAQPNFFTAEHAQRLMAFADQAAAAIENAQLHTRIQRHAEELEERVQQRTRELTAANVRLTELDRLKDQFVSRISHELRTPLTSIKIYLEMLDTVKPEKRANYMQVLTRETSRLQALIEDLLEVSQLAAAQPDADLHPIDLNRIALDLCTDRAAQAQARDLTLRTDLSLDLPASLGEASLVFQAAARVMANALAYTPRGGTVTLSTARQPHAGQDWITLTVRDTGPGISAADLPHIFERFYRGAAASDYTVPGTGLGLAISQNMLINLGGRLTVESQPDAQRGAAFTLWLRPAP